MLLAALLFFSYDSLKAQVKIGGNPAVVDPNALLELESNRKGLLLPRLNDAGFTAMTGVDATVGMVVYYTGSSHQGPGLYVKQTAGTGAGNWVKLAGSDLADGSWKLGGNLSIDPANQFLGTTDAQPVIIKTDAVERFKITETGQLILAAAGIPVDNTENQVLLLAADGTVKRKSLSLTMVESMNGQSGALTLKIGAGTGYETGEIDASTPGELTLNLPVMSGANPAQAQGFISYADWVRFDHMATAGVSMATPITDGSQGTNGATVTADGSGGFEIALGEATAAAPGIVNIGAQTFGGDKTFSGLTTFSNNVTVDNGTGGGNLDVKGKLNIGFPSLYAPSPAPASYNLLVQEGAGNTEIKRFNLAAWKLDGGIATVNGVAGAAADGGMTIAVDSAGAAFNVVADAVANKVTINIPDAATATDRGLVNNDQQTFGGHKLFASNVTVNNSTPGTSSLSVNGSVGLKFRRVFINETLTDQDYLVFVKPSGTTDVTITLPDPTTCSGRVYVIKREAKDNPVNELNEDFSVVIASNGGTGKFHGENTTPITVPNTTLNVMSDGTNWNIMSRGAGL
ncbi:hypothetical protein CCY01nite_02540 [Chitinophaga cymbidii]|uniref:Uncharacterized protein n=2 Tax=Chitinophaga cymbidii TaxID=1096750 RepID=A0A512REE0_9BACT|nr:hypothetical protein CCY01nite_02540 [Chitinophaga cymbidii]